MQFIYPSFLWALSAISIPVIIHLFNFRKYKKVYFSSNVFLSQVQEETQSKSKLKHLLVLIARILSVIFLVLAFAQPFIPNINSQFAGGQKLVSIYIDNSFSMEASDKEGNLLDAAKKSAEEIAKSFKPSDKFQLLTADFEGKQQRWLSREEFLDELNKIKTSAFSRKLKEIVSRQTDAFNSESSGKRISFVLSDFQKNMLEENFQNSDTNISLNFVALKPNTTANLFIDSCFFKSPVRKLNLADAIEIKITNTGDAAVETAPLKLFINGEQKSTAAFSIGAKETKVITVPFTNNAPGTKHCYVEIQDHPITYDDRLYFNFEIPKSINVLSINGENANNPFKALFSNDSIIKYREFSEKQIDYSVFAGQNFIIVNQLNRVTDGLAQELKKFLNNGGNVLYAPGEKGILSEQADFINNFVPCRAVSSDTANNKIDYINFEHPLFTGVFEKQKSNVKTDYPFTLGSYKYQVGGAVISTLIKLQNGNSYLSECTVKSGKLYLLGSPLSENWTNFTKHALFVPVVYQMAISNQANSPLFFNLGKTQKLETPLQASAEQNISIQKTDDQKLEIIPEQYRSEQSTTLILNNEFTKAGNYNIMYNKQAGNGVSFNYNRSESMLEYLDDNAINSFGNAFKNFNTFKASEGNIGFNISGLSEGTKYWKACIFLALCFILAEILLIRFFK